MVREYRNLLEEILFLDPNPRAMREYSFVVEHALKGDGSNLSSVLYELCVKPERHHCSRNPKWGPSDFGCTKLGDGHGLRRPAFVLRPSRHALRAAPGLLNNWTPCRMAEPFVSACAHALDSDETLGPTPTRGSSHSARRLRSLAFLGSSGDGREVLLSVCPGN